MKVCRGVERAAALVRGQVVVVAALIAFGLLPAAASGATICVHESVPGCDSSEASLQLALDSAAGTPAGDRVVLGAGLFEGPFVYSPGAKGGAIEVVGQGPATVLTAPAAGVPETVLNLIPDTIGDGSSVSSLTVRIPANTSSTADTGVYVQNAGNVRVASDAHEGPGPGPVGIYLAAGGAVRNSVVELIGGEAGIGVLASGGPDQPPTTVTDSRIIAPVGLRASAQPTSVVRSRIIPGTVGVFACNATVTVEDVLVRLSGSPSIGLGAEGTEQCGPWQAALVVRQTTIVGSGLPGQSGVFVAGGSAGQAPAADVTLSILRNLEEATSTSAQASSSAAIRIGASDFEAAHHKETGAGGVAFEVTHPDIDADPIFADSLLGDLSLGHGSPAIDSSYSPALGPGESTTDLNGNPRVLDGNGDGIAARDMGAIEAPAVQPAPDRTPPDTQILSAKRAKKLKAGVHGYLFKASFSSTEAGSTFECRLDAGKFAACSSPFQKRLVAGLHRFEVRAVDAAGNVDPTPARESLRIARAPHKAHGHRRHRAI